MKLHDIIIRIRDLPYFIHGVTITNPDGSYNVYLNAHDSYERQEQAKQHELEHIQLGDFDDPEIDVVKLEQIRKK